eukprot:340185_1
MFFFCLFYIFLRCFDFFLSLSLFDDLSSDFGFFFLGVDSFFFFLFFSLYKGTPDVGSDTLITFGLDLILRGAVFVPDFSLFFLIFFLPLDDFLTPLVDIVLL